MQLEITVEKFGNVRAELYFVLPVIFDSHDLRVS